MGSLALKTAINRQFHFSGTHAITLCMEDPDVLIAKNLRRLRLRRGLSQAALAVLVGGIDKDKVSGHETGNIPVGKAMLMRYCKALKARPWEFYFEDTTPIISKLSEQDMTYTLREAEKLGVAEDIMRYGKFLVQDAKKKRRS